MKPNLAPLLRCLDCGKSDWDIKVDSENSFEVREGNLICRACRAHYPVQDGILGMLRELSEEVAHEKKHAESFSYLETREGEKFPINRETLNRFRQLFLSLPAGDGSDVFKPGGSFDNQAGNARRFFKTLEMLKLTGSERVLEVGASFGWSAWRFAQKGCDVVALDVTDYLMAGDLYMEADGSFFNRMTADMNGLPFRDETFDLIFAHSVLHHCKDVGELFRELRRVLRPGGRVVALQECAFGIFEDKSGKALQEAIDEGFNENAYTLPQWTGGAKKGGFKHVRLHFFSFIDDYIDRKKLRGAPLTQKLKAAYWIQSHPLIHQWINFLSIGPRILLRPKSWMMIATK